MARALYRRRPDGICEIVKPTLWEKLSPNACVVIVALGFTATVVAGAALYLAFGPPALLFAVLSASAVLAYALWRSGRVAQKSAPPPRAEGERKTAP